MDKICSISVVLLTEYNVVFRQITGHQETQLTGFWLNPNNRACSWTKTGTQSNNLPAVQLGVCMRTHWIYLPSPLWYIGHITAGIKQLLWSFHSTRLRKLITCLGRPLVSNSINCLISWKNIVLVKKVKVGFVLINMPFLLCDVIELHTVLPLWHFKSEPGSLGCLSRFCADLHHVFFFLLKIQIPM